MAARLTLGTFVAHCAVTPYAVMKATLYLEVVSSWCHLVEPTWAELKRRYAGRVEFQWKIALMRPEDFPVSRSQCDWFYRRSGLSVARPKPMNSGWFEPERKGDYSAPNLVAEAGKDLGFADDRLRLALAHAALIEGKRVGDLNVAVASAASALGIDPKDLKERAQSLEVRTRVEASTAEFYALKVNQRPAFLLEDPIGDRAVFSGLIRIEPLTATLDAMFADTNHYASFAAHFGPPPSV